MKNTGDVFIYYIYVNCTYVYFFFSKTKICYIQFI